MAEVEVKKIRRFCETFDDDLKNVSYLEQARRSSYVKKVMKEMLYNDVAPALGEIQATVLEGAYPAQIARKICWVIETTAPTARIFKVQAGTAAKLAQGVPPPLLGPKPTYVDVAANIELGTRVEYSLSFLEDTPRGVLRQLEKDAGLAIATAELEEVEKVLDAISASDLAGGATLSPGTANKLVYTDVLNALSKIDAEGYYKPGSNIVCVMNPESLYDALLSDDKFINSNYKTAVTLNMPGAFSMDVYGITYFASSKIDTGDVYVMNADYALALVIRRDITVKPFETTVSSGFDAVERIGIGVLNTKAIAKITGA
jgi:hypothetical protein